MIRFQLVEQKKSSMIWDIVSLIHDEDLEEFSEDLKEAVRMILGRS